MSAEARTGERIEIELAAPPRRVYEAIATADGVRSWWTDGEHRRGGRRRWDGSSSATAGPSCGSTGWCPDREVDWTCVGQDIANFDADRRVGRDDDPLPPRAARRRRAHPPRVRPRGPRRPRLRGDVRQGLVPLHRHQPRGAGRDRPRRARARRGQRRLSRGSRLRPAPIGGARLARWRGRRGRSATGGDHGAVRPGRAVVPGALAALPDQPGAAPQGGRGRWGCAPATRCSRSASAAAATCRTCSTRSGRAGRWSASTSRPGCSPRRASWSRSAARAERRADRGRAPPRSSSTGEVDAVLFSLSYSAIPAAVRPAALARAWERLRPGGRLVDARHRPRPHPPAPAARPDRPPADQARPRRRRPDPWDDLAPLRRGRHRAGPARHLLRLHRHQAAERRR